MRLQPKLILFLFLVQLSFTIPITITIQSNNNVSDIPQPPLNLTASNINNKVVLHWNQPVSNGGSNISNYNVYRSTNNNNNFTLLGTTVNLSFKDTTVSNNNTYYYIVKAENSAGESDPSNLLVIKVKFYTPIATYFNKIIIYLSYLIHIIGQCLAISPVYLILRFKNLEKTNLDDIKKISFNSFIKDHLKINRKSKDKTISIHQTDKALEIIEEILE